MDTEAAAAALRELFPAIYHRLHQRRDPRVWAPSNEALAMLEHLSRSGPLSISEAARHFDRSQAAISERIDRLTERGLVERMADERDRRRHFVWLTEEGLAVLATHSEVLSPELALAAVARMSVDEREALIRGMRALIDASRAAANNTRDTPNTKRRSEDHGR